MVHLCYLNVHHCGTVSEHSYLTPSEKVQSVSMAALPPLRRAGQKLTIVQSCMLGRLAAILMDI